MIAALFSGIVEVLSPTFGFIFVSAAALVAAGLAFFGVPFLVQLACFSAVLLASLVFLRPRFAKTLEAQGVAGRTQALIGKSGVVTVAVDPVLGAGRALVEGQDWAVRCRGPLPEGTAVRVEGADGIVLDVGPAEGPDPSS